MQARENDNHAVRRDRRDRHIRRERRTVDIMVRMFCEGRHQGAPRANHTHRSAGVPCPECAALLDYALRKVNTCPFGANKPACVCCTVHCYRPEMREHIREVMRYSGPRMTIRHPYLALRHLLDRRRRYAPDRPAGREG